MPKVPAVQNAAMTSKPRASLAVRSTRSLVRLLVVQAIVLFASAGTFAFWQAWVYLGLHLVSSAATNAYLLRSAPSLMERRLALEEEGESDPVQKRLAPLMYLVFFAMLLLSGLDHRLGWSAVPVAVEVGASVVFGLGALLVIAVFRENHHASSVIEVSDQQTVVTTGPYRFVRHPMYAGVLVMGAASALVLGSWVAVATIPPACAVLAVRLLAEERFLSSALRGYREYMTQTPRRLIPGLW